MPPTPYAAITLGSNSFNMLIAQTKNKTPQIIAKYKQKVRLAEGIDEQNNLTEDAIIRGLHCLEMFSLMLAKHQISIKNIRIIATATLRSINNAQDFTQKALPILGLPIDIISGEKEAELIYQGMVANTQHTGRSLVIDIGGASTEFIVGENNQILCKSSHPFGCVTINRHIFNVMPYSQAYFSKTVNDIANILSSQHLLIKQLGWENALGASGSVQSVIEILAYRQQPQIITLAVLESLKQELLIETEPSLPNIIGLNPERAPTFAASIAILLALFGIFNITTLHLSGGALREGVLLELMQQIEKVKS